MPNPKLAAERDIENISINMAQSNVRTQEIIDRAQIVFEKRQEIVRDESDWPEVLQDFTNPFL